MLMAVKDKLRCHSDDNDMFCLERRKVCHNSMLGCYKKYGKKRYNECNDNERIR